MKPASCLTSAAALALLATTCPAQDSSSTVSPTATFALSNERFHDDSVSWLRGLRGFEHFYEPVGQPLYFESPFNNSGLRFLYLYHTFADDSQLGGGHLNTVAMQARIALTERWQFIATKDGYSWIDTGATGETDGWNQLAAGFKYVFLIDRENDMVAAAGSRIMFVTGEDDALQSDTEEVSPYVSFAKGWDKFHTIADLTVRVPFDDDDGNTVLQWDLHADYEIAPETLPGFAPLVELHGLHYLSDGDRFPLSVGGLDYTNLGSADVSGSTVVWAGVGARWKLTPNTSVGGTYEFALTDADDDIMDQRVTLDFSLTW